MNNWITNPQQTGLPNNPVQPIIPTPVPQQPIAQQPVKIAKTPDYDPARLFTGLQNIERSYAISVSKLSDMVQKLGKDGEQTRKILDRSEKVQSSMHSVINRLSKDKVVNLSRELGKIGMDKESRQIYLSLTKQNQKISDNIVKMAAEYKTKEITGEATPELKREYEFQKSKADKQQKELADRMDAFLKASVGKVELSPEEQKQYRDEMVKVKKEDLSASLKRDAVMEKMTGYLDKLESKKDDMKEDEYLDLQKKIFESMSNIEVAQTSTDIKGEMDKLHKMLDPKINIDYQKKQLEEQFHSADKISGAVNSLQEKLVDLENEKKVTLDNIEKAKAERDNERLIKEEAHYKKLEQEEKQQNKILTNMVERQKAEDKKKKDEEKNKPPFFKTLTQSIGAKGGETQVGDIVGDAFKAFGVDKKMENMLFGKGGKDGGGVLNRGTDILKDSFSGSKGGVKKVGDAVKGLFGRGGGQVASTVGRTALTGVGGTAAGGTALTGAATGVGGAATAGTAGAAGAGGLGAMVMPALAVAGAGLAGGAAGYGIFKKVVEPMMDKDQKKAEQAEIDYSNQRQSQVDTVLSKKKEELSKSGKTMSETEKWDTVLKKTAAGKTLGTSAEGDTSADKEFRAFLKSNEGRDYILNQAKTSGYKDKSGKTKVKIGAFDFDVEKIEKSRRKVEADKEKEREMKAEMKKPAENVFTQPLPPQPEKTTFIAVPVKERVKAFERLF